MAKLSELLNQAWTLDERSSGPVIKPSLPVLWFGDIDAYAKSELRIVTVGLNPSGIEFSDEGGWNAPTDDNWCIRFPAAQNIHSIPPMNRAKTTSLALNQYFREQPYNWFNGFESVLSTMNATYGWRYALPDERSAQKYVAIHTDLCSPLATDPAWSKLDKLVAQSMAKDGAPLWNELIKTLKPHAVIMAIGEDWQQFIELDPSDDMFEIAPKADAYWTMIPGAKTSTLVVRAPRIPPSAWQISTEDKKRLGEVILRTIEDTRKHVVSRT